MIESHNHCSQATCTQIGCRRLFAVPERLSDGPVGALKQAMIAALPSDDEVAWNLGARPSLPPTQPTNPGHPKPPPPRPTPRPTRHDFAYWPG